MTSSVALASLLNPGPEELEVIELNIATLRQQQKSETVATAAAKASAIREPEKNLPYPAFQLASVLITHSRESYIKEGVEIMELFAFHLWKTFRDTPPPIPHSDAPSQAVCEREQDWYASSYYDDLNLLVSAYYYLAIGQLKLGDLVKARSTTERVLELKPSHPQAVVLRDHIDNQLYIGGMKGLVALGAAAIVGVGAFMAIVRRNK